MGLMHLWWMKRCAPVCLVLAASYAVALGQSVANYTMQVSAAVQTNPPQIAVSWVPDSLASEYWVFRRFRDDLSWDDGFSLPGNASTYLDSNVVLGGSYEYSIYRFYTNFNFSGDGYV